MHGLCTLFTPSIWLCFGALTLRDAALMGQQHGTATLGQTSPKRLINIDKFYGSLRRKRLRNLAADLTNLRCDPLESPPKRLKVPVRAYHLLVHIDRAVNFDLDRVLSL